MFLTAFIISIVLINITYLAWETFDKKISSSKKKVNSLNDYYGLMIQETVATRWELMGSSIDGAADYDFSGHSVSVRGNGNTLAIGAFGNDDSSNNAGHVRVYEWTGSAWIKKGQDIGGEAELDSSGRSVVLSQDGNIVAIGATGNDGNGLNAGHVRVFEWIDPVWVQKGNDIDGEVAGDVSSSSLSMNSNGNIVAIGAHYNDDKYANAGHVRIFEWINPNWVQKGSDIDGEAFNDQSGGSVSLNSDGHTVAIGAIGNDGNGYYSGHVRIYEWLGTAWVQKGEDIDGESSFDKSGGSVSLSSDGDVVAIGATENKDNGYYSGHVRVHQWNGNAWVQKGQDIDGEAFFDKSGGTVSLSSDGNTVAIGAIGNTLYKGHVRIFEWNGSEWVQKGQDIDGESSDDRSGQSVSLSSNGNIVAIGAAYNDGSGVNAGHVKIYRWDEMNPTAAPTSSPVIVESPHVYYNDMNEKWLVDIAGATCYTVTMDPQSWTPDKYDFVRIFAVNNGVRTQFRPYEQRLYKKRLSEFPETDINADSLEIEFKSNSFHTSWGFRAYITQCI